MQAVLDNFDLYLKAFGYTVALFIVAGILSMLLGTALAACRVGPVSILRKATAVYVTVTRNTPLVIIFATFSFMAPMLWSHLNFKWVEVSIGEFDFSPFFAAAVVSLTLYTSSFVCEALRSGVNAVPVGQAEAARAIGSRSQASCARSSSPRRSGPRSPRWPACRSR